MIAGVALLPRIEDSYALVEFRAAHDDVIGGPAIGMKRFPPHVSILQAPMDGGAIDTSVLQRIREGFDDGEQLVLRMDRVRYQDVGWLFLDLIVEPRWLNLQARVLDFAADLIRTDEIDRSKDISGYSEEERRSYFQYGYRYVGSAFRPHITLGRLASAEQNRAISLGADFEAEVGRWQSVPRSIVFYAAGPFGVADRILAELEW